MLRTLRYWTSHVVRRQKVVQAVVDTLNTINRASSVTLGPMGRLVAIQNSMGLPRITKDGITVVKNIDFPDRLKNNIATLLKQAANNANKYSGDGTTTTTLLVAQLIRAANKLSCFEANQTSIRKGLQLGRQIAIDFVREITRKVESEQDLMNVALISTNGDKLLSKLISESLYHSQSVKVEKGQGRDSYLQYISGYKITRGIPHEMLVNKLNKIEFDYPLVVVSNRNIEHVKDITSLMEKAKIMRKPVVIFAPDISEAVCSMLYYNHSRKILESCPVRVPGNTDFIEGMLKKIVDCTDALYFTQFTEKIENIDFEHFGKCIKITIDEFETEIISKHTKGKKNAILHVGANSQAESLQAYDKAVDALNSVRNAQKEGIVPGGGITYLRVAQLLDQVEEENQDVKLGIKCLSMALRQPIRHLLRLSQKTHIRQTTGWQGYDFRRETYCDMYEAGIVDSATVVKNCIIDSVGLAGMLLSLQTAIVEDTKYQESDYRGYKGKYTI